MSNMDDRAILEALLAAQDAGEAVVLATIIRARGSVPRHAGTKILVYPDGRFLGTIGGGELEARVLQAAQACLQDNQPRNLPYSLVDPQRGDPGVCGGELEVFLEPYLPPATLWVIGCGHVGRALARLGHHLGYRIVVYDDRAELAAPENIPEADVYLSGSLAAALEANPLHRQSYIALVTRNVMVDREILPLLAAAPAPYIGVMGSRRRWTETKRLLLEDGLSSADLERFHSPIGLELNAETPDEIALSILAEITMLRRGGAGKRMPAEAAPAGN